MIGFLFTASANSYSQNTRLSVKLNDGTVAELMKYVEKHSDFVFLYKNEDLDMDKRITIDMKDATIQQVLDAGFKNQNVGWDVYDRQIVVHGKEAKVLSDRITQQSSIGGVVTDKSGLPLPGVTIMVAGTTVGTVTDADGKFSLAIPDDAETLQFSFVGMRTVEVSIDDRTIFSVVMEEEAIGLEEVVAIGYATRKAGELTGSVSTVQSSTIEEMAVVTPAEVLRTASGVSVRSSNTPGGGATVRIRGLGTINDNDPLWVVDGIPGGEVNPNNIESISILKDAAAQAIYGARAAGGVILVTTKSGKKKQKAQISVSVRSGISKNSNYYDMLNTQEYGEMLWLQAKNDGIANYSHPLYGDGDKPDIPEYIRPARATDVDLSLYDDKMIHEDGTDTYLIMKANKEGTDWLREASRSASYVESTVDLNGGSDNTTYSFQMGYLKEEGILKWTGYNRYNLRSNVTSDLTSWLQIGERLGITYSESEGHHENHSESSAVSWAYRMQPIIPVHDVAGNYAGTRAEGTGNAQNPLFILDSNKNDLRKRMNINGNVFLKLNLFEQLSFRTLFGVNHTSFHNRDLGFVEKAHAERGKYDSLTETARYYMQWNWTNTIEYSDVFDDVHNISAIVGSEAIDNNYNFIEASRSEFFSKDINYMQVATGLQSINNDGNNSSWALFSLFARVNYSYASKYLFEGVVRRDGSSRFGSENPYGIFPAFSVGWRITEESFMAPSASWLNELKIRAGYGETGNDRIGNYNSYTNFGLSYADSFYPIDGANVTTGTTGFYQTSFGNPNVKWETTQTTNIGFDGTLFKNIDFSLDLWKRRTSDMLYPKQIPMVLGQADAPSVNVGEMKNVGIDFELGYTNSALNGELKYNVDFDISTYKNEIVKLSDVDGEFLTGDSHREMVYTRAETGTSFPEFYGYVVEGIFQSEEEAAGHPTAFGEDGIYNEPGHYKYKDVKKDGVINSDDRTYIGSPHPDFTTGLNLNVSYKGINLVTYLYCSYGNEMVNYVRRFIDYAQFQGGKSHDRLYNSWGSPYLNDNSKAKLPLAETDDNGSQQPSTAFVEDASYLRMEHLRLGYDLNRLLKTNFRSLQLYGQVTNVFTITGYSGLDPEISRTGKNMGIDTGAWPTPRRFMIGLSLGI
ncbi:TonB-dependent receptor [Mariniphaga anaerophila]|nr:TonB-dependent receptor [Mariniphaga anaerophila]